MQVSQSLMVLFLLHFLFLAISSLNEHQLFVVKKCLPYENFMGIAYILNRDPVSDQQLSDLAVNLGENLTIFQFQSFSQSNEVNNWEKEQSQFIFNQANTFHQDMNSSIQIDCIRNDSVWLLTFNFKANDSDATILSTINNYFKSYGGINIKTTIYVIASSNNITQMFEVYRKGPKLNLTIQMLCKLNGLIPEYINQDDIWTRRKNLSDVSFQVGLIPNNVLFLISNETVSGLFFDILEHVKSELGFTYNLVQSENDAYGSLDSNNKWTGQVGMVHRKEVDFSGMAMSVLHERAQVVSFTTPIYSDVYKLFMVRPKQSFSWTTYTDVFEYDFWIAVIIYIATMSMFTYMEFKCAGDQKRSMDASNSLAIVSFSFLALDIPVKPRGIPRRILIFSVCLTGALLYWSYSACLVSFLTAEKIIFPITSFSDLIDKPKYTLLLVNGSSSQRFFSLAAEKNPDSEEGILWKRALENPDSSIKNYEMAENMMLENPYHVLFAPEAIAKFRFSNYPCLIYSSSKILATEDLAWAFTKHSTYRELFNKQLNRMKASGIMNKLMKKQIDEKPLVRCREKSAFKAISYENILVAFIILPIGFILALLTLFVERCKAQLLKDC